MTQKIDSFTSQPPPKPPNKGKPWVLGCGLGCGIILILIAVAAGFGYWGVKKVLNIAENWVVEFEEQGYQRVEDKAIEVTDPVAGDTVYKGLVVIIKSPHAGNVAIISQTAEIYGPIKGDLDFRGQMLMLKPGAVIGKDLRTKCQLVQLENEDQVLGEISGQHQLMTGQLDDVIVVEPGEERSGKPDSLEENSPTE